MDYSMIEATSGGALIEKTLEEAWDLISNMAANSYQFGVRIDLSKRVNAIASYILIFINNF